MPTPSNSSSRQGLSRREFLKRASVLGAGIPLASALAACAVPTAPATQTGGETAPGAEPYTVEFWDMVWGPPEYVDTGKALVEQFNEEHTDIQATYQSTPSFPEIQRSSTTAT